VDEDGQAEQSRRQQRKKIRYPSWVLALLAAEEAFKIAAEQLRNFSVGKTFRDAGDRPSQTEDSISSKLLF
jgi:hypothetical protein